MSNQVTVIQEDAVADELQGGEGMVVFVVIKQTGQGGSGGDSGEGVVGMFEQGYGRWLVVVSQTDAVKVVVFDIEQLVGVSCEAVVSALC